MYQEQQSDERHNGSRSRGRPRRHRRIFNFYGLNDLETLPRDLEETFERLRRTRRPRSMFGSGSLRRNGVVEPEIPNADATQTEETTPDNDETWIFYIVSAVLPEGHPLLSAPSLFTDNPTYEDMLFLDNFLHKPVASRSDVATAGGIFRVQRRANGELFATNAQTLETIELPPVDDDGVTRPERCLICLSDFEDEDDARKLVRCNHLFHRECIDTVSYLWSSFGGQRSS